MTKIYFLLICFYFLFSTGNQNAMAQSTAIEHSKISIEIEKKDTKSPTSNDGQISVKVKGGVAPYKIHCFSPYSAPSETSGGELNLKNIKSGDYLFVIQDKTGAIVTREVKLGNE